MRSTITTTEDSIWMIEVFDVVGPIVESDGSCQGYQDSFKACPGLIIAWAALASSLTALSERLSLSGDLSSAALVWHRS